MAATSHKIRITNKSSVSIQIILFIVSTETFCSYSNVRRVLTNLLYFSFPFSLYISFTFSLSHKQTGKFNSSALFCTWLIDNNSNKVSRTENSKECLERGVEKSIQLALPSLVGGPHFRRYTSMTIKLYSFRLLIIYHTEVQCRDIRKGPYNFTSYLNYFSYTKQKIQMEKLWTLTSYLSFYFLYHHWSQFFLD